MDQHRCCIRRSSPDGPTTTSRATLPGGADVTIDEDENHGVLTLGSNLRDALAGATDEQLATVVIPWSKTEEFTRSTDGVVTHEDRDTYLDFLHQLRELARRARANGHRLYWYFEA